MSVSNLIFAYTGSEFVPMHKTSSSFEFLRIIEMKYSISKETLTDWFMKKIVHLLNI